MENFQFYQTVQNIYPNITFNFTHEPNIQEFTTTTLHSMFKFIRSNELKKSFSEIAHSVIQTRSKNDPQKTLELIENVLICISNPTKNESKYLSLFYIKIPSKKHLDLIWNVRECLIQVLKKDNFYFKSMDGLFILNSDVAKVLTVTAGIKEIKISQLEKDLAEHLNPDNSRGVMDTNELIFAISKAYSRYNCYALRDPGIFIPVNRQVKAYVYSCFK